MQKLAVEITPDGVIDEPFWGLRLTTSLVLEYNIIIPPSLHIEGAGVIHIDERVSSHQLSLLHLGLFFCLLAVLPKLILSSFFF
jgi:hypothetical protein